MPVSLLRRQSVRGPVVQKAGFVDMGPRRRGCSRRLVQWQCAAVVRVHAGEARRTRSPAHFFHVLLHPRLKISLVGVPARAVTGWQRGREAWASQAVEQPHLLHGAAAGAQPTSAAAAAAL